MKEQINKLKNVIFIKHRLILLYLGVFSFLDLIL